jgi:sulfopropanediol 3-dehydrogenase
VTLLGGVQGVAALALGLCGLPECDIVCGPGNAFVAEAKMQLQGRHCAIDMLAGPTDTFIIADGNDTDPFLVAWDLVGQAEHGADSPVVLATTSRSLAEKVIETAARLLGELPDPNGTVARAAWERMAEVIVVAEDGDRAGGDGRGGLAALAAIANEYAPEHLHAHVKHPEDRAWLLEHLTSYGSLFLGEEVTVAYGDKAAGPNHVLPTSRAARFTGGLSVHKFLKTVTFQHATAAATLDVARATANISRAEGMVGHARSAEVRLEKYSREGDGQK